MNTEEGPKVLCITGQWLPIAYLRWASYTVTRFLVNCDYSGSFVLPNLIYEHVADFDQNVSAPRGCCMIIMN